MTSRHSVKLYIVISGGQYLKYKYFIYGVCNNDCNKLGTINVLLLLIKCALLQADR